MNAARLRPRPEQIGELTRGLSLPLPHIPHKVMLVVVGVLEQAWMDISGRHPDILTHGSEAEISTLLESRLIAMRDEDSCWESLISGVSRGRESVSFDGRHLEKRPDLSFHLTGRNFSFPMVAECKLIDHSNGKTVRLYCEDGLARFLRGEYAWGTREAFMFAYVRDQSGISTHLNSHLASFQGDTPDPFATELLPCQVLTNNTDVAQSRHGRLFPYLQTAGSSPGPIVLWHVWLSTAP